MKNTMIAVLLLGGCIVDANPSPYDAEVALVEWEPGDGAAGAGAPEDGEALALRSLAERPASAPKAPEPMQEPEDVAQGDSGVQGDSAVPVAGVCPSDTDPLSACATEGPLAGYCVFPDGVPTATQPCDGACPDITVHGSVWEQACVDGMCALVCG